MGKYLFTPPTDAIDFVNYKGDTLYMTANGYTNLSYELSGEEKFQGTSGNQFGDKINGSYSSLSLTNTLAYCPKNDLIIASGGAFNSVSEIAVFATDSGKWCTFYINEGTGTDQIQQAFENKRNGEIYISYASGEIRRTNLDAKETGLEVICHARSAWTFMGDPNTQKQLTGIRFQLTGEAQAPVDQGIFTVTAGAEFTSYDLSEGLFGNASNWGDARARLDSYEATEPTWVGVSAFGYFVTYSFYAAAVKDPTTDTILDHWRWYSTSVMFNRAGAI